MITVVAITIGLTIVFALLLGIGKRREVMENWSQYRGHPFYMMTAFLYKPDADPRSRFEFMNDNFAEVMRSLVADAFKMTMAPIFDIFQLTQGGIVGSMGGVRAQQNIMSKMMASFDSVFSIFDNRYKATLFRLAMTFRKLQSSMSRVWAVSVNSVYTSMATMASIMSAMDLIMKICIIILVIMVAIIFFLFLFMWPFIPVILSVVGILTTAGMGASVGGMAGTFCFAGDTQVKLATGKSVPIRAVKVGDVLDGAVGANKVTAFFEFQQECHDIFDLEGIRVTGSHIVWYEGKPIHVRDHPAARRIDGDASVSLYCLNTESHRIPVLSARGTTIVFADWEELDDDETQQRLWNTWVFSQLNPGVSWNPATSVVDGEAGFHPATLVHGPQQSVYEISHIRPGMMVQNEEGDLTRVLGVVELARECIGDTRHAMADAVWRRRSPRDPWQQGGADPGATAEVADEGSWYSLITESGTFRIVNGEAVRDFTDVGIGAIDKSYEWVLEAMEG